MKLNNSGFFWPSFTDLMTSLFFIMLVLYILTYVKLSNQQRATRQELNKIKEIEHAVKELPSMYFTYDPKFKRFSLNQNIEFPSEKYDISYKDKPYLINVGKSIKSLIDRLKTKYSGQDIRYIVIIEGMASIDSFPDNYVLSYQRALAVKNLWLYNQLIPDESVCEVQIAGSGIGGIGRYPLKKDKKNQRILIQIVPKISNNSSE